MLILESQVMADRKLCVLRMDLNDVIDVEKWICVGTEFHTQGT